MISYLNGLTLLGGLGGLGEGLGESLTSGEGSTLRLLYLGGGSGLTGMIGLGDPMKMGKILASDLDMICMNKMARLSLKLPKSLMKYIPRIVRLSRPIKEKTNTCEIYT